MAGAANRRHDGGLWIFLCGTALTVVLAMMGLLLYLLASNSFLALWPAKLELVEPREGAPFLGEALERELDPDGKPRQRYKVANRDLNNGADFRWVSDADIAKRSRPADAVLVGRLENGDFYGYSREPADALQARLAAAKRQWNSDVEPLRAELARLGDRWQDAHLAALKAEYEVNRAATPSDKARWQARLQTAKNDDAGIKHESEERLTKLNAAKERLAADRAVFTTADGRETMLQLTAIESLAWPNQLTFFGKVRLFLLNGWNLLSQYPRDANTEGGLFPALFGTVLLVFLMAMSAFPLGVAAGIYLREYARDNLLSRAARVAVNNLAGVPSIVYGICGLGFFVYGLGGSIDQLFYPERVAAGITTFGAGGIIWSSLTLGLLTLPVVVVSTEEALATVPSEIRQGSLALGATRFQTLWRVVLPMAAPGVLTGFILAMARAAGEVAPLMLTGVVKSAPALALDGSWPYLHLERKFMHLGFHIYDMGFQSPNVEASKPMVYLTAMVLVVLVFVLNLAAIALRKRMRDKYAMRSF